MNFSGKFGSDQTIWYPASGYRDNNDGGLRNASSYTNYWSASPYIKNAYSLQFGNNGYVDPSSYGYRATGYSVRCLQE